jgi:hypothetical protein
MAKTLQEQGVPIRDRLTGPKRQSKLPARRHVVQQRTPIEGEMGGTQTTTTTYEATGNERTNRRSRVYSPTRVANKASGVGLLEAEFLAAIILLILLMFANTGTAYGDKIMSLMKRGFLVCVTFIILALTAGIGPNAARVAKALGGLIVISILLTTPVDNAITLFDKFIKADWAGQAANSPDSASADTGTAAGTSGTAPKAAASASSNAASAAERAFESAISSSDSISKLLNPADEAKGTIDTVKGIIDGINSAIHSIHF